MYMYMYVDMCESTLKVCRKTLASLHIGTILTAGGNYPGSGMEPCLNRVKKCLVVVPYGCTYIVRIPWTFYDYLQISL